MAIGGTGSGQTLTLTWASLTQRAFLVGAGDTLVIKNATGTTSGGLVKNGPGTLRLDAQNGYTGTTTINDGSIRLEGGANRIKSGNNVVVNTSGTLDLNTYDQTLTSLTGGGHITMGSGGSVLTVANGDFSGDISQNGALTKNTTGTLVLRGANTYSGATTLI